nr:tRNA1(Val) (adenine(37)-N6)-methyltransferase [Desulfobacterales bacterium]
MIDSINDKLTVDCLFHGQIKVLQEKRGYRFSIDAVILAHHVSSIPYERAVDLGTGCGVIPIILAYRKPSGHIYGVEVQKTLAELARKNVFLNKMEDRISIIDQDLKEIEKVFGSASFDLVFSNPPYRRLNSGRINPYSQRAIARHEIMATLEDIVKCASHILINRGRMVVIYLAERIVDLVVKMREFDIEPKLLRTIHAYDDSEAKLIILEGIKGGKPGLKIGQPLVIYTGNSSYTEEIKEMLEG